jgi:integrase
MHYFGTDRDAALKRFLEVRDDLYAGRTPRPKAGELTVADLANHFLTRKRQQVDAGELSARMWSDYHAACESAVDSLGRNRPVAGLADSDFASLRATMAKRLGPVALGVFIQRTRTVFKFGYESGLLEVPIRYGQGFDKPARRVLRKQRSAAGPKMISAADVWKLVEAADSPMDAMILLGVNCGFGQADISELPRAALARRPGWVDFPRPKTGIGRRCPLWPETVEALKVATLARPDATDPADNGLAFITRFGRPWVRYVDKGSERRGTRSDAVALRFTRLVKRAGVTVPGGFYTLRHVFRTVADEARDTVAAGLIMGHDDPSMAGAYREQVSDERLRAVTDHVRGWLLAGKPGKV